MKYNPNNMSYDCAWQLYSWAKYHLDHYGSYCPDTQQNECPGNYNDLRKNYTDGFRALQFIADTTDISKIVK